MIAVAAVLSLLAMIGGGLLLGLLGLGMVRPLRRSLHYRRLRRRLRQRELRLLLIEPYPLPPQAQGANAAGETPSSP